MTDPMTPTPPPPHPSGTLVLMRVPEWRPIETAPKDGTRLLLAKFAGHPDHESCLWWCVTGHWSSKWKNWNDGIEPCGLADPSHWMHVPKPWPMPGQGAPTSAPIVVTEEELNQAIRNSSLDEGPALLDSISRPAARAILALLQQKTVNP